jgi:hypothetical protein
MRFDLVFAEVCRGRAGIPKDATLPTNIKTLVVPSVELAYQTIDYGEALKGDVIDSITAQLVKRVPNDVATLRTVGRGWWEIAVWWLPLGLRPVCTALRDVAFPVMMSV